MKLLQRYYIVCLLTVTVFALPKELVSQFTYLEAGLGNTNVVNSSRSQPDLYYHNISVRLSGLVRFKKHIGVGGELNVPVLHHNRSYSAGGIERYFKRHASPYQYLPQDIDYTFRNTISGSLFARFFADSKVNLYGEVRFTVVQMKERFVFNRDYVAPYESWSGESYPEVDAVYIDETLKHMLFAPGLAIGAQPRLGKKFFINFKVGVDFYFFNDNKRTNYEITNSYNPTYSYTSTETIGNYGRGVRFPVIINLGFGYFF